MGSFFVWYLWASYKKASLTDSWIETPAKITSSVIDQSQLTQHYMTKHRLDLTYDYQFKGEKLVGTKIRRLPTESGDLQKVQKKEKKYPVGAVVTALVNPEKSTEVILEANSKAALYSIWFPCLFIVGGLGIILAAIFRKPHARA